jgi:hypothetical protein
VTECVILRLMSELCIAWQFLQFSIKLPVSPVPFLRKLGNFRELLARSSRGAKTWS